MMMCVAFAAGNLDVRKYAQEASLVARGIANGSLAEAEVYKL